MACLKFPLICTPGYSLRFARSSSPMCPSWDTSQVSHSLCVFCVVATQRYSLRCAKLSSRMCRSWDTSQARHSLCVLRVVAKKSVQTCISVFISAIVGRERQNQGGGKRFANVRDLKRTHTCVRQRSHGLNPD